VHWVKILLQSVTS